MSKTENKKIICESCNVSSEDSIMFKCEFLEDLSIVEEYYCSDCLATILTEDPESCIKMEVL